MTEEEYWDAQRESDAYYEQQALQDEWHEWFSAFEFLQRALDRMQHDPVAIECGAVDILQEFLQKQWEQREKIVRLC